MMQPRSNPGIWIFLDDEERFLESLRAWLPREQPFALYSEPSDCITYLARNQIEIEDQEIYSVGESAADYRSIVDDLSNLDRFFRTLVLIVDYSMPQMTGLEFLEQVQNKGAYGSILLTGVADETIALDAMNAGVIDHYIKKGERRALVKILEYAKQIVYEKNCQIGMEDEAWRLFSAGYGCRQVSDWFSRIVQSYGIVEYYFCPNPLGFLCMTAKGESVFLALGKVAEEKKVETKTKGETKVEVEFKLAGLETAYSANELENFSLFSDSMWGGVVVDPPMGSIYSPRNHSLDALHKEALPGTT